MMSFRPQMSLRMLAALTLIVALLAPFFSFGPVQPAAAQAGGRVQFVNLAGVPYNDRLVFNRILGQGLPAQRDNTIQITNVGTGPLTVQAPVLSGPDIDTFITVGNVGPFTIPPGESRTMTFRMEVVRGTERGIRNAIATIATSDPSTPQIRIELAGFMQPGTGGDREPTMQEIFDLFGYGTVARYPFQGNNQYSLGAHGAYGDEVLSANGLWTRANPDEPIYARYIVATHGDTQGRAYGAFFRIQPVGSGSSCTALAPVPDAGTGSPGCAMWHNGPDWQRILPRLYVAAESPMTNAVAEMRMTTTGNFAINIDGWRSDRQFNNPPLPQAIRVYPMRDRQGRLVPNTYLVGQDYVNIGNPGTNYDYQDSVVIMTNIRPATVTNDTTLPGLFPGSENLILEFDREYPGTLVDQDGQTTGFRDTQRNGVGGTTADQFRPDQPPTTSYNPAQLNINTAGQGTLAIASTDGSNANTTNTLVNGMCVPFNAGTAKFVMQTSLLAPFNMTGGVQQAGLMFGPNQHEYVKLAVQPGGGGSLQLQFARELDNVSAQLGNLTGLGAASGISRIDLQLTGDPATGLIEAAYSVNNGPLQKLATTFTLDNPARGRFFERNGKGCILAFHRTGAAPITATFDRFAITPAPELTAPRNVIRRYNVAGPTVNLGGNTWQADTGIFTPANSPNEGGANVAIANTTLDQLYQTYRGQVPGAAVDQRFLNYAIPLLNNNPQNVSLRLHFAELFWGLSGRQGPNRRLFDVYAEGKRILTGFDIFSNAGAAQTAVVVPLENILVEDGILNLTFHARNDNISISAIEVLEQPSGAPIVNAGIDQKVNLGAAVTLTGNAIDNNPPLNFVWTQVSGPAVTLSNGGVGQSVNFTAPNDNTVLEFELTVTNGLPLSASDRVRIVVGDIPIVGLTASNNGPREVGQPVQFNTTVAEGDNITYTWNFGDGNTGTGPNPIHTYTGAGTFQAVVTATNNAGSVVASTTVTVNAVPPFALRINAGGPAYTDNAGRAWLADLNNTPGRYSTGNTVYTANPGVVIVDGEPAPTMYRTERYAQNFNYNIPVPGAGQYEVTLHFAEIYLGAPGGGLNLTTQRLFDVNIIDPVVPAGSEPEIDNLNLRALVGSMVAYRRTFVVNVTDGTLNINLNSLVANGGNDNAKINGIEVVRIVNQPPTVNAGPDQTVQPGTLVNLSGTVSDPESAPTTFTWSQVGGPTVTLTGADTLTPSFTPAVKGAYVFQLRATDPANNVGSDLVTITAANRAPTITTATATPATVDVGQAVQFNVTAADADSDPLTYAWAQTSGPLGGTLTGGNLATASFTPAAKGTYEFTVTVSDGDGGTVERTVTFAARNRAPTVTATATPATVDVGAASTLAAVGNDLDGDALTYVWEQIGGPIGGTLTGEDASSAEFTPATKGAYVFRVTVNDGDGGTATATVNVTARNRAPIAAAGADQDVDVGTQVTLDGTASSDPDSDALTYAWTQTGGPAVTLSSTSAARPTFTAPAQPATLTFELVVTDVENATSVADSVTITVDNVAITGLSASNDGPTVLGQPTTFSATVATGSNITYVWDFGDGNTATGATVQYTFPDTGTRTVIVTATNSLGETKAETLATVTNTAPIADTGSVRGAPVGTQVTLDGRASTDPDGHTPLTYAWTQTGGPTVTLTGADTAQPTFTAPATPATLTFELVVTDARGLASEPATLIVEIAELIPQDVTASNNGPTVLGRATRLTAVAEGSNLTFTWDLGDGNTATGAVVNHTYAAEGAYIATVSVSNTIGVVGTATTGVTVTNAAPTADAGSAQEVQGNTQVTLRGTANDADGHTPLTYAWTQLSGPAVTLTGATTATATFTAPNVDARMVFRLTVTDAFGKSATDTVNIEVRRETPAPDVFRLYLPIMRSGTGGAVASPADLAITNITATPANMQPGAPARITVTVKNNGGRATGPFWVDLYINPNTPPSVAGVTWDVTCTQDPCQGIAWLVEGGLAPGASITLTSDATSYYAANTRWNGSFTPGTNAIYAYADSWNLDNPNGIVAESDERNNRGQLLIAAPSSAQPSSAPATTGPALPDRFIP